MEEDAAGWLQTAYGTYDAMYVEAIRALNKKIENLEEENIELKGKVAEQESELSDLEHLKAEVKKIKRVIAGGEVSVNK